MFTIYYLTTEFDNLKPRYIGYTSQTLEKRLKNHINDSKYLRKRKKETHKTKWINKNIKNGYKILIFQIETTTNMDNCLMLERKHVESNINLTNSTNGGEISKTFDKSIKAKISKGLKNYYMSNGLSDDQIKNYERIRTYKNYTYDELYELYITKNLTQIEISIILKIPRRHVCKLIKRNNLITIKKEIHTNIKGTKYNKEDIINMYYNGIRLVEIATKYNVDIKSIRRFLKKNNVAKRKRAVSPTIK